MDSRLDTAAIRDDLTRRDNWAGLEVAQLRPLVERLCDEVDEVRSALDETLDIAEESLLENLRQWPSGSWLRSPATQAALDPEFERLLAEEEAIERDVRDGFPPGRCPACADATRPCGDPPDALTYIAGPYTHPDPVENTRRAVLAGMYLWTEYRQPSVIPHLTLFAHFLHPLPVDDWYEFDLGLLARCTRLVRLPGASTGADREVERARELGIEVTTPAGAGLPVLYWTQA